MAIETLGSALRQINRLFADGAVTGLSDAQLLERFVGRRDSEAFEAILARHGPMVLGVCRGILRDPNDAEDAFQATFLILIKKAGSIRANVVLGGWLYQVAYRVAVAANTAAARRRILERKSGEMAAMSLGPGATISDELFKAAHEALARLPAKYRLAILLCDLEGKPQSEAARELNWSERTLRRRLAAARERLKSRLSRHGWAREDALLSGLFLRQERVAVPEAWREMVVRTAVDTVNQAVAAGAVSAAAQSLVQEVLWTMLFTGLKQTSAALLALSGLGILAATFAGQLTGKPGRRDQPFPVITSNRETKMELVRTAEIDKRPVPISGSVVDQEGKPLAGATIYVYQHHLYNRNREAPPIESVATAGADGRFRFDLDPQKSDSPRGEVPTWHGALIAAVAPGYGPVWTTAREAAGGELALRLIQDDLPIRGRIIDSQGRPVASAVVQVEQIARTRDGVDLDAVLASGKLDWDGSTIPTIRQPSWPCATWIGRDGSVTTDSNGSFEFRGLGRDHVALLRIIRQGMETAQVAVLDRNSHVRSKAPGRPSPTFSSLYGEMGLELYGATLEHVLGPSKPITGVVRVKGTADPVVGVTVTGSFPGRLWSVVMTQTDEHGRFRIDGLWKAQKYRVDARPVQGSPYLGWSPLTVSDTEGLRPIDLTRELTRGVAVRGRVIDKTTGQPVPCDWIQYYPLPGNPDQGTPQGISSGTDNTFQITIPHGGGMIAVKARGKSLPYPGAQLNPADKGKMQIKGEDGSQFGVDLSIHHAHAFVDFPDGTEVATLDLEVMPVAAHKVELVGPTGQPVIGASAMGLTTDPFASTTIEGASFDVYGLRLGETRLVEIRHEGVAVGGSVTVVGSDPADRPVIVKLERFGAIAGRVLDEDGLPLAGAKVSAIAVKSQGYGPSDPNFRPRESVSDGDGRFRVDGINPSLSVRLWFHKPGAPPYSHTPKPDKDMSNLTATGGETLDVGNITVHFNVVR